MSRSRKKTKIFGHVGGSEKKDKRHGNRAFRRKQNAALKTGEFDKLPIDMDEVMNVWSMQKDGKHYWQNAEEKDMRK